jgi:hypothetical protein
MRVAAVLAGLALVAGCTGGADQNEAAEANKAATPPTRVAGFDWGNPGGELAQNPQFARSQALCRAVAGRQPPAADRPDPAAAASLASCDAEALYYGIGVARDPARARLCAFTQNPTDQMLEPFAGRAMLMTIYANGEGATRNLDLAIRMACTIEGAEPAEYDRRVTHLAALRDRRWQGHDFSYCDDIDPGLGGLEVPVLQQFDRYVVRGADEGHVAIARRPVDRVAGVHQPLAAVVDILHPIGEMAEIAALAIAGLVPVMGELDLRLLVARRGEEGEREPARLAVHPADLLQPEHGEEADRRLRVRDADHRVQISHCRPFSSSL